MYWSARDPCVLSSGFFLALPGLAYLSANLKVHFRRLPQAGVQGTLGKRDVATVGYPGTWRFGVRSDEALEGFTVQVEIRLGLVAWILSFYLVDGMVDGSPE